MPLPASLANRLELPVLGSPLFIVSGPELVIAQCKAGIVGSFPALNARPAELLDKWIERIKTELDDHERKTGKKAAPFAVNQIVHASNDRVQHDMAVCVKHKVPIIITSWKINVSLAIRVVTMAELVGATTGIGYGLTIAQNLLSVADVFAWTIVLVIILYLAEILISWIESRALRWRE